MEELRKKCPDLNDEEIKEKFNEGEEIDMFSFYDDYSEISVSVFKKMANLFQYIDMQKVKNEKNYRISFISVHNKYWSYVFQASPSIYKDVLLFFFFSIFYDKKFFF